MCYKHWTRNYTKNPDKLVERKYFMSNHKWRILTQESNQMGQWICLKHQVKQIRIRKWFLVSGMVIPYYLISAPRSSGEKYFMTARISLSSTNKMWNMFSHKKKTDMNFVHLICLNFGFRFMSKDKSNRHWWKVLPSKGT